MNSRHYLVQIALISAFAVLPLAAATVEVSPATAVTATTATLNGQVAGIGPSAPSVTFFWGTANGETVAEDWQNNFTLPGTQSGAFSTTISGLTPATIYYFVARATDDSGASWSEPDIIETATLPASISTGTATQISASAALLGANVTDTGGDDPTVILYYGTTDGGTTTASWASAATLGSLSGVGSVPVSGLLAGTTYYFRAFARNSGGSSWATTTSSFTTVATSAAQVINLPASGITGTTASLRGEVTNTGNNPPAITLFYGPIDGGATTSWANSAALGIDSGNFTRFITGLTPSTTYYFRCRAINSNGTTWAPSSATFTTSALVSSTPVIHEIHYHPADDVTQGPLPLEFIELRNPGDTTIDLSNWKLATAVTFTFPAGTTLAGGGLLVIAQNPATLLAKYGVAALGPWVGKLSNSGDTLELRDATNLVKDTVSYQAGFPWPTSADGLGSSIELINPNLDNDLGGSWRSSGAGPKPEVAFISPSSTGWKFKKGTAEASSPITAWRTPNFVDTSWFTGQTPVGYGSPIVCNTLLSDMAGTAPGNYSTVYARKTFTIPAGQVRNDLILKVRIDDGCIVWINGTEVYRARVPSGEVAYNKLASSSISNAVWTTVNLTGTSVYLLGGTNVLAIQGLNAIRSSADFNIDAELKSPGLGASPFPSPAVVNTAARILNAVPPQIRKVAHTPAQPTAGVPVSITARITDPDGVSAVDLAYQVVDPGAYIRKTDPAYLTAWAHTPMVDDGTAGDLVAGDSIFTALIPASVQTHRRLVRYQITSTDTLTNSQRVPYEDDEQPNFAYFVYNGIPAWTGSLRATDPAVTYPAATVSSLQAYHLIANATDVSNCQYVQAFKESRLPGALVYNGIVYDHIQFKLRGQGSPYECGKNKWNIAFNRSRDLVAYDNWGKKYNQSWNNLLLNANASPWVPGNRGSGGIEEASSARLYELAGNTNFRTNYAQLRVIDDAVETSATSQFEGDLWGLYLIIEPPEGNMLEERGLPDGSLYSLNYGIGNKKHQAPGQSVSSKDWEDFKNNLSAPNQTEAWYRANMDLDKLYTHMAINRLIGNVDAREHSNMLYYQRSSDNRWELMGYDYDMTFVAAHHWGARLDNVVVAGQPGAMRAIMRHPTLAREFRNRCRELMDLLASDSAANGGQIGQVFNEYAAMINPVGQTVTWVNLDAAMWNRHPKTTVIHRNKFFSAVADDYRGNLEGTFYGRWRRTLPDPDGDGFSNFPSQLQWFVDFATDTYPTTARGWARMPEANGDDTDLDRQKGYGYKYLEWESIYGGYTNCLVRPALTAANTDFPARPTVVATGNPAFPTTGLSFTSTAFSDPQGPATYAAWQWRIAEISAPGIPGYVSTKTSKYEIESLYTSPALTTSPGSFSVPLGVTTAGKTYRVRVRHKDTTGNWSHWSTPAQFAATAPVVALMHYWNFNTPATQLIPTQTLGGGTLTSSLTSTSAIVSDTGNNFAATNARAGDLAASHLRVNNPLTATVNFALPTTGHQDVIVRYETRRSTQGAGLQTVSYTVDGSNFTPLRTDAVVDGTPEVRILDFRGIPTADNNPAFALRITFQQGTGGITGNNRFDNLTVEGEALAGDFNSWKLANFPDPADQANPAISGPDASPAGDGYSNLLRYALGAGRDQPVTDLLPQMVNTGGASQFRFRYDPTKPDLIWRVKATNTLTTWDAVLFDSTTSSIPPLVDGQLSVTLPATLGTGTTTDPTMFVRLEVQLTP